MKFYPGGGEPRQIHPLLRPHHLLLCDGGLRPRRDAADLDLPQLGAIPHIGGVRRKRKELREELRVKRVIGN